MIHARAEIGEDTRPAAGEGEQIRIEAVGNRRADRVERAHGGFERRPVARLIVTTWP